MTVKFTWPIYNPNANNYDDVQDKVLLGGHFRQPVTVPADPQAIDGIELLLSDQADPNNSTIDVKTIYACFDGELSFHPQGGGIGTLKLHLALDVKNQLKLYKVEPTPQAIHYGHVDMDSVRDALLDLVTAELGRAPDPYDIEAWTGRDSTVHRLLRVAYTAYVAFKTSSANASGSELSGDWFDQAEFQAALAGAVDTLLSAPSSQRFPVRSGDRIGVAALLGQSHPELGDNPHRLVIKIQEFHDQLRNPLYDLWSWLNAAETPGVFNLSKALVVLSAPHNLGTSSPHPLLKAAGLSTLALPRPAARPEVSGLINPSQLFPIGWMKDFHTRFPTTRFQYQPVVEWRFDDAGFLEARVRSGQTGSNPNLSPNKTVNNIPISASTVSSFWNQHGQDIADMSRLFQVPCELMLASLCVESGSSPTNMRAAALEPIKEERRLERDAQVLGNARYQELIELYRALVPASVQGRKVPAMPWGSAQLNEVIVSANGQTLTWGLLAELLQLSSYIPERVSVGLGQQLLSSAQGLVKEVALYHQDLLRSQSSSQSFPTIWALLNVATPPATPLEYLQSWLVVPRHTIMLMASMMRGQYNRMLVINPDTGKVIMTASSYFDPPRVAAGYGSGSIKDGTSAEHLWGMLQAPKYIETAWGSYFNGAVKLFNDAEANSFTLAVRPPVRFGR